MNDNLPSFRNRQERYGPSRNHAAPGGGDPVKQQDDDGVEPWIKWTVIGIIIVSLIAVIGALAGCKTGNLFDNLFSSKKFSQDAPKPPTSGELATYAALIDMARWSFGAGILCLIGGVLASHWFPPLKVLTSIGTTLIAVGISTAAACLLLDRYGGWTAAILLVALVGALGMWIFHRWTEGKWQSRMQKKIVAARLAGEIEFANALEQAVKA
jgi:MFS family permease